MPSTVKRLAGPMLGLALGLVAGFAVGHGQGFNKGMGLLETEVGGTLSMHVEAASCIRVGDTERGLKLLDTMIDAAVMGLVVQPGPLRAPRQMSQAKLYLSVTPADPQLRAALESVPAMEVPPRGGASQSRSGLVRLAQQAAESN
jgi:hypothetical protein